jgi:hypothetical protein
VCGRRPDRFSRRRRGQRAAVGAHGLVLRPAELALLLGGIDLRHARQLKRYQRPEGRNQVSKACVEA